MQSQCGILQTWCMTETRFWYREPKPGFVIENGYSSGVVEDGGYASFDVDFLDDLCEP